MTFELATWQQIVLALLAVVSLVYVFYFKIWVAIAAGSDLIFAMSLGLAITSVAVPVVFSELARELVDRSALPEALASADAKVAAIESLPRDLLERALRKLGYEPEQEELLPEPSEPTPGPFETRVRPSVEGLVAAVLRAASFFTAAVLILMALALRSSTSTTRMLHDLSKRTASLEARLVDREATLARTSDPPSRPTTAASAADA
jgi:hypothetical protein